MLDPVLTGQSCSLAFGPVTHVSFAVGEAAIQCCVQGLQRRRGSPVLQQHSLNLPSSDSTPETRPVGDSRKEQSVAVLAPTNEITGSVQSSTRESCEAAMLGLSTDASLQANMRHENTAAKLAATQSRADNIHAPASAMSTSRKAGAISDPARQEGSALSDLTTALSNSHRTAKHMPSSFTATDESCAGAPNEPQLDVSRSAVLAEATSSKSPSLPFSANVGCMSTPEADMSDRSNPADQQEVPHVPESKHSKGLQQLWNCVAHTPLALPSPCSMTGKQDRRHTSCEEQGHPHVLVSDLSTPAVMIESSTASSSAASQITELAIAHAVGLAVEAANPDR